MTDIEWGPAIAVDGKRPGWLADDDKAVCGCHGHEIRPSTTLWFSVESLRLPADHPHYRQPTPQADTKPDVTTRMEALVRGLAEGHRGSWTWAAEKIDEARAIVALLPEPVDPDLIEAREIVAKCCKWFSNAADQRLMVPSILDGSWDEAKAGLVQATLAAIKRGRELALAGETGK